MTAFPRLVADAPAFRYYANSRLGRDKVRCRERADAMNADDNTKPGSMRVALVNSPAYSIGGASRRTVYFPIGLLSIGATLRKHGFAVRIFDINNIQIDAFEPHLDAVFAPRLAAFKPRVVGIGGLFSGAWPFQKLIAQCVRRVLPEAVIVLGGIHATMFGPEILDRYPFIDYVVIGEGEETTRTLLERVEAGSGLADVDGLVFRTNGGVQVNPKTKYSDLDLLPAPDYSLINVGEYHFKSEDWWSPRKLPVGQPFPILTSRSCPKRCSFCSMHLVHGPRIRFCDPMLIVDEIERLHDSFGATYFEVMDDNLTFDRGHVLKLCAEILRRKLRIQFCTPNGVAVKGLDSEVVGAMVEAGLVRICLAIESGSLMIRNRAIGKGLSDEDVWAAIEACVKYPELFVAGFFVLGMPQETRETLVETVELARALPLDKAYAFYATPYPGTVLYRWCTERGLIEAGDLLESPGLKCDADLPHFVPANVSLSDLMQARDAIVSHYRGKREATRIPDNRPFRCVEGKVGMIDRSGDDWT